MEKEEFVKVMIIEPKQYPIICTIKNKLEEYQRLVGGYIEVFDLSDGTIVCNEEGKINGLDLNRVIRDEDGKVLDVIAGTMVIVGTDYSEGEFISLTDGQIEELKEQFYNPEVFFRHNGEFYAVNIGWKIDFVGEAELIIKDDRTNDIQYTIACNDELERIKVAMAINRMKSEVLRGIGLGQKDFRVQAKDILENAVDPFNDVWDDR